VSQLWGSNALSSAKLRLSSALKRRTCNVRILGFNWEAGLPSYAILFYFILYGKNEQFRSYSLNEICHINEYKILGLFNSEHYWSCIEAYLQFHFNYQVGDEPIQSHRNFIPSKVKRVPTMHLALRKLQLRTDRLTSDVHLMIPNMTHNARIGSQWGFSHIPFTTNCSVFRAYLSESGPSKAIRALKSSGCKWNEVACKATIEHWVWGPKVTNHGWFSRFLSKWRSNAPSGPEIGSFFVDYLAWW